jgi:AbiV family abortive infection protein
MDVTAEVLLQGAWYSLDQCGRLLRDAVALYRAKAYPSGVALAMIGLEELGKYRLLLEEWKKVRSTEKPPTVETIQNACADHAEKQSKALLSVTFTAEGGTALDTAMRTQFSHSPGDAEYQEAEKVIQTAIASLARRAPHSRHMARMRALFVDLQESGSDWSRPSQVTQGEAKKLLDDAANDYAGQRDRFDPARLREMGDATLAEALEALKDRPELPQPVWTE